MILPRFDGHGNSKKERGPDGSKKERAPGVYGTIQKPSGGADDPAIAQGGGVSQAAARDLKKSDEHSGRGTESRYAMIRSLSVEYAIKECCEALGVCRSGYYQWKKAEPTLRDREEAELVKQIGRVFAANKGRYGSPRVSQALRQDGIECGENRVARLIA